MLTRLSLAFRVLCGLGDALKPTVTREQYDEMRAFYQQHVIDLRKINAELTKALIEERSPGTHARLSPQPVKVRVEKLADDAPEMPFA